LKRTDACAGAPLSSFAQLATLQSEY